MGPAFLAIGVAWNVKTVNLVYNAQPKIILFLLITIASVILSIILRITEKNAYVWMAFTLIQILAKAAL